MNRLIQDKLTPSYVWKIFLVAAMYFVAARFGLALASAVPQASLIWPASGIALAVLLLAGWDLWPGITIGAFAANMLAHEPVAAAAVIGIGNTLEAALCAILLEKFSFSVAFNQVRDVIAFILFSLLASMAGALIGTLSLFASGLATFNNVHVVYAVWAIGDAFGIMLFTPALLMWFRKSSRAHFFSNQEESIIALIAAATVTALIYFYPSIQLASKIKFLIFPFFVWASFRLGRTTTTTMCLVVGSIATIATLQGAGPFGGPGLQANLMYSHLFIYVISGMGLLAAAAIKERDDATRRIASNEKRLKALTEHSTDGIVLINQQAHVLYVTIPTLSVLGYKESELLGKNIFGLVHVSDQAFAQSKFTWLVHRPGKSAALRLRALHKQGHWVWIGVTATNMLNEPSVEAIVLNYHDITEQREHEEKIQVYTKELEQALTRTAEEVAKEEALLSSIGDGFIATDKEKRVIFMNPAAEQISQRPMRTMMGRQLDDVMKMVDENGNEVDKKDRPIQIALATGKTITTTASMKPYYYVRPNGTKFPVAVTVSPVILGGEIIGAEEIFKDITNEQRIDRAKTEFVSLASHQLRTPLAIVNWYTEALIKGKLGPVNKQQNQYLRQIYAANQRLVSTVNNLLNVSRLEMGTFPVELVRLDVRSLIAGGVESFERQIREKNLSVTQKLGVKEVEIFIDRSLLSAVLDNLISNAVKYTDEGGTIRVGLTRRNQVINIAVEDSGYGIPEVEQARVFDRFYRGSNVAQKITDGNGLGLYIVKRIVEFMGGTIKFDSKENKGTTFFVTIPIPEMKGPPVSPRRKKSTIMT